MKNKLIVLFFVIMILSCETPRVLTSYKEIVESFDEYNTYKTIILDTIYNESERFIEFENKNAIIYINVDDFLNYLRNKLDDESFCNPKKDYLKRLRTIIDTTSHNFFYIEKVVPLPNYDLIHPPYGYVRKVDTANKIKLENLKYWIISEMCINGNCLIIDKRSNLFVEKIYYLITDFKDGHGGESLIFEDKMYFFIVDVYSCLKFPDYDCMTESEIKQYNERLKKERRKK